MATVSTSSIRETERDHRLDLTRLIVTGGATAAVVFVFCWVGTFITFSSPTHGYIALFTSADISSGQALAEGTLWSLLFGALVGAIFGVIYNATARFGRK
jgi:amino acid permease